jgi:signal transduction histidine kinase
MAMTRMASVRSAGSGGIAAAPVPQPSVPGRWPRSAFAAEFGRRYWAGITGLAIAYYGAAHLGYAFAFAGPVAAIIWLPAGVGIAFLYLGGLRLWPGVLVGDLLVNNYSALPLASALGQTCGNVLEVLVATLLIGHLIGRRPPLATVADLTRLLGAIAAGTALSAVVGAVSLRLGQVITTSAMPKVWRTWWLGDASGALLVVPLALAWSRPIARPRWNAHTVEAALMLAAITGLSELAMESRRPLAYLVFPALIWAGLRFGQRGATLAISVVAAFAVWKTVHYLGPFAFHSITRSVLSTQLYIAVAAVSTLCLAAVVAEREELDKRLSASRGRLISVADAERRRLEHNLHDGAQQRLTALAVRLGIAARSVRQDPDVAAAAMHRAEAELGLAIDEVRDLAHGLHPAALTNFGLSKAIERAAMHSPIPIEVVLQLRSARLDPAAEAAAYYVFTEAITNAQRHAQASLIRVRAAQDHSMLHIEITDDGVGGAAETAGLGLQGLRDRVETLGGAFELDSTSGHGTRIVAAIPAGAQPD